MSGDSVIEPLRDPAQLREYIDQWWRKGHVLARDEAMFRFTYSTPWVDKGRFPAGFSVFGAYAADGRLTGFLGSIVTPYPRPQSYWLALWHVLPELKGTGAGGKLLGAMQRVATEADGWIGTFGAGPEALPVYLKRGYACRAVRRFIFDGTSGEPGRASAPNSSESEPDHDWLHYRYEQHPVFDYEVRAGAVFRTEENDWGRVTHVLRFGGDWRADVEAVHAREEEVARAAGQPYLMDAWAFDAPDSGWSLAGDDVPSVFHPPEARGNLIYASGHPFVPVQVGKGDCDQDRPN